MGSRTARAVVVSSFSIVVGAVPALAGVVGISCTYDDVSTAAITVSGGTATVTVSRSGDAIHVNAAACETATVTNTDTITLDVPTGSVLVVDLSGGALAPGLTNEGNGSSEIEISEVGTGHLGTAEVTGTADADHLVADESGGLGAINLNAAETTDDFDVTFSRDPSTGIQLTGNNGADTLAAGSPQTPVLFPATLDGGAGDDTLTYFANGGLIDGGPDTDVVDESGTSSDVTVLLMENLHVANGNDPVDMIGVEDAIGGDGDDQLYGDDGPNHLQGIAGSDILVGAAGNDVLNGGVGPDADQMFPGPGQDQVIAAAGGFDAISYSDASSGVSVSLLTGTATGDGNDTLTGEFLVVTGSAFDDVITGNPTTNLLEGHGGNDNLRGDAGNDLLEGGAGNDVVGGGLGDDSLGGGDGRDVLVGKQGADEYLGGAGVDEAEFLTATHRMIVDLRDGTATGQGQDLLSDIERVDGGPKGDRIRGDGANNDLDGFGGDDRLFGRAGNDRLSGGGDTDTCSGGPGTDQAQRCEVVIGVP